MRVIHKNLTPDGDKETPYNVGYNIDGNDLLYPLIFVGGSMGWKEAKDFPHEDTDVMDAIEKDPNLVVFANKSEEDKFGLYPVSDRNDVFRNILYRISYRSIDYLERILVVEEGESRRKEIEDRIITLEGENFAKNLRATRLAEKDKLNQKRLDDLKKAREVAAAKKAAEREAEKQAEKDAVEKPAEKPKAKGKKKGGK